MHSNTEAAIAFLHRWAPNGPWILTAITVQGTKTTTTRTYTPGQEQAMGEWIEGLQGKQNIYFMVNPATGQLNNKAAKTNVLAMAWLHVDIDPRAGETIKAEKKRALRLLAKFKPGKPTVCIDSGNGIQGFWKLNELVPVNGDEAKATELEAYNQQLEILFHGDHCHNVDRIMRLPGTINLPDVKKAAKGRVPVVARLLSFRPERVYSLKQFTPAPIVQNGFSVDSGKSRVKVSGNVQRLASVEELPDSVSQRMKAVIVQGGDPLEPTKYSSRSEALFAVCCELVRAGCTDDTIYAVITDPDFGISASVLDKNRSEKYALRQIEKAREQAIDPMLRELNEKHAVIGDDGGKCRIISIVQDHALGRERISKQSFEDFSNRYRNIKVQVGFDKEKDAAIEKPAGKWWIDHPQRRQFETIVFAPGREIEGVFNLWTGFVCEARPGDCGLFIEHIKANICSGVEEHYEYVLNWLARTVQQPDRPGEVALVLRGKQGTGKGVFAKIIGSLFGRHFLQVADPKLLVGSFNAHLRDCVVVFGDEAFYAGDKKHESVLKMMITEETLAIEAKGVDAVASPNFIHLILASNNEWVIPAGAEERRFLVLDVADDQMQNNEYFGKIREQIDAGGREALLHFLLSRDISKFDVRKVPKTGALADQKEFTHDIVDEMLLEIARRGYGCDEEGYRENMPSGLSIRGLENMCLKELERKRQPVPRKLDKIIRNRLRALAERDPKTKKPLINYTRHAYDKDAVRLPMYDMGLLKNFREKRFAGFDAEWEDRPTEWMKPPF